MKIEQLHLFLLLSVFVLPTLANFRFDINWDDRLEQCLGARQAETSHLLRVATDKLLEEEVTQLLRTGNTNCLSKATESMTYTYAPKEYHYTLYYYDQAGNLVQTVPPKGVKPLTQAQISSNADPAHTLPTRYAYNSLNQLTAQQTPDAGKSAFWYDSKGQLRLSQNAQQQADNHYSYTRYDALGRVTEVGEMTSTEPAASLQALLDDSAFPDNSYGLHDITATHYDEPAAAMMPVFAQQHLRSRVSWVEVIEDPQDAQAVPVRTYYSYDAHGNVKALLQQLPGMPAKRTDYVYDLVSGNVNMVIYQYGVSDQMMQQYLYDADNRLQQVHTSTDGYVWNKEAMYKYYAHGPLSRIELGQHRVQGLDYYYTLQGWLKGVNGSTEGNDPGQDGMGISRVSKDAFAFALGYFEGDYQGIGATPGTNQLWTRLDDQHSQPDQPYKGLYNGNIAWMQTDLPGLQDKPAQAMLYRYDQLNRLVLARGLNQYDAASGFAARSGSTGPYDAAYTYDANGNLLSLDRHKQDGSLLDEFDYSYTANTNRLASVEDASVETITYDEKIYSSGAIRHDGKVYRSITVKDNATAEAGQPAQLLQANESITLQPSFHAKAGSGFHAKWTTASNTGEEISEFAYEYDAIGNLTHDRGEGTNITWTPYGKVRTVSKGDGTAISYQYDAAGNRISKAVTSNNQTRTTHYVRDASGNVLSIYQDEQLTEQPIYGSSRLGMYRPKESKADGSLSLGQRHYELSNHLGNMLSVITDEVKINAGGLHEPVILQQQDYFGFGLAMEGRSWQSESYSYKYGFNGKEKDTDFQNNYDYGFRIYNPSIGKFLSVDPIARLYPELTPYQYASNSPIENIDLDGLEKYTSHYLIEDRKKTLIKKETDNSKKYQKISFLGLPLKPETIEYIYYEKDQDGTPKITSRTGGLPYNPHNLFESFYIGPDNPKNPDGSYDYNYEPLNLVDAAAKQHDIDYDNITPPAAGPNDALTNLKTLKADRALVARSKLVIDLYHSGKDIIDPYTGSPISKETYNSAKEVYASFKEIVRYKEHQLEKQQNVKSDTDKSK